MRIIEKLKWVQLLDDRPAFIAKSVPKGKKAMGLRYERALGKLLGPKVVHGQWFVYEDANGKGYAQTDFLLYEGFAGLCPTVLEAKYTWTPEGHMQIEKLYAPLLKMLYGVPEVHGIVVCRVLTSKTKAEAKVFGSLEDAYAGQAKRKVWHWLNV